MVLSNGCAAPGPAITACIVDSNARNFDCITYPKTQSLLPFEKGEHLQCVSPPDLEALLKACKAGQTVPVTLCSLKLSEDQFVCKNPSGLENPLSIPGANNYACMSEQDRTRMLQRCHR